MDELCLKAWREASHSKPDGLADYETAILSASNCGTPELATWQADWVGCGYGIQPRIR